MGIMDDELLYIHLNDWEDFPGEPVDSWLDMMDDNFKFDIKNDKCIQWAKDNRLVVTISALDMSINVCIIATKSWVEKNCPCLLLPENESFLNDVFDDEVYGKVENWGQPYLEYKEENFGMWWLNEELDHITNKYTGVWTIWNKND